MAVETQLQAPSWFVVAFGIATYIVLGVVERAVRAAFEQRSAVYPTLKRQDQIAAVQDVLSLMLCVLALTYGFFSTSGLQMCCRETCRLALSGEPRGGPSEVHDYVLTVIIVYCIRDSAQYVRRGLSLKSLEYIVHHICTVLLLVQPIMLPHLRSCTPTWLLLEISNIPLVMFTYAKAWRAADEVIMRLAIGFALCFVCVRVLFMPALMYMTYTNPHWRNAVPTVMKMGNYGLCALQYFWLYKLIAAFRRKAQKSKKVSTD